MTLDKLKDFHRRRLQVLVKAGPDLLAFETIPNKLEAQVCSCCCWLLYISVLGNCVIEIGLMKAIVYHLLLSSES